MLLIQQVSEKINSCDYVRCPSCKSGRLCDKTLGVQIRAVPITDSSLNKDDPGIILKCPKCGKKFEIQIRTILQHAWSAINHDIGYKSDFGVPREVRRQFARLAGLLELADDEFVRARDNMVEYTEDIRRRIITDDADDITINMISLNEYVQHNQKMQSIIREIADIAGAEISEIDPESYIPQLAFLGITKLGDIEMMIKENYDLAMKLAEKALSAAELDIVSSSVALRFLCRAELLNKNYDFDKIVEFLKISLGTKEKAERQAKHLLRQKEEC